LFLQSGVAGVYFLAVGPVCVHLRRDLEQLRLGEVSLAILDGFAHRLGFSR
jgi:hypothetical protein